jgi:hypothetical protein
LILRQSSGSEVSARVDGLILRYHNGDRGLAARRLGIKPELLTGLLSGDWRQFSLDALVAVIRTHGVTIEWLLGSTGGAWEDVIPGRQLWNVPNIEPETLS